MERRDKSPRIRHTELLNKFVYTEAGRNSIQDGQVSVREQFLTLADEERPQLLGALFREVIAQDSPPGQKEGAKRLVQELGKSMSKEEVRTLYIDTVQSQLSVKNPIKDPIIQDDILPLLHGGELLATSFPPLKITRRLIADVWFKNVPEEQDEVWRTVAKGVISIQVKAIPSPRVDPVSRRHAILDVYREGMTVGALVQALREKGELASINRIRDDVARMMQDGIPLQLLCWTIQK